MPWDANIATTQYKGKLPLQSFNQLQAAIKERCQAAGVSVPSIFNADMVKMTDMLPDNWFSTFQSTMSSLIGSFVNHANNSGNWTGQITIPNWTEATLLTAIGDGSRKSAPSAMSHRICASWCYQQYEMLNMMRWIQKLSTSNTHELRFVNTTPQSGIAALWAIAPWSSFVTSTADSLSEPAPPDAKCSRIRATAFINYTWASGAINIDAYILPRKPTNSYSFDNEIGAENVLNKYIADSSITFSGSTQVAQIGFIDTLPLYTLGSTWFGWRVISADNIYILKFDGANGFTYKDW
jgi:hypothetical protein